MATRWEALKDEYEQLWKKVKVRPGAVGAASLTAKRIAKNKERYELVAQKTDVPWFVIGLIHAMECGLSFSGHLHNGDPLTKRTRQVPSGRPKAGNPPFTWEESAEDALRSHDLHKVGEWTPERMCYELERYNGWGYRNHHPGTLSPYLWSGTNHYTKGKYVADGLWSSTAVSGQSGAITICKQLMEMDPTIFATGEAPAAEPTPAPPPIKVSEIVAVSRKATWLSRMTKSLHAVWVSVGLTTVMDGLGIAQDVTDKVKQFVHEQAYILLIAGGILGALAIKYVLALMAEDANEGRYTAKKI